jgi:hypothetical protein
MLTKTTITVVAAAAMFGAISAAQAADRDDGTRGEGVGSYGYRIGPLGQPLGGPMSWRGRPSSIYAYVPRAQLNRNWIYSYAYAPRSRLNRSWIYDYARAFRMGR